MGGSFWQVAGACAAYAALHTLLLTDGARRAGERALGANAFRRWYRLLYSAVAAATLGLLLCWSVSLPDAPWFRVRGGWAAALWGVRLAGLGLIGWAVSQFGLRAFLGFDALVGRWGTDPDDGLDLGSIRATGPYRYVRHPMYAAGLVVLLAEPVWTANRAALILVFAAYLVAGAFGEERRLLRRHGEAYRRYRDATPMFWPRLAEKRRSVH